MQFTTQQLEAFSEILIDIAASHGPAVAKAHAKQLIGGFANQKRPPVFVHFGGLLGDDHVPNQTRYWVALLVWRSKDNIHLQFPAWVVFEQLGEDRHTFRVEQDADSPMPNDVFEAAQPRAMRLFSSAYTEAMKSAEVTL